MSKFEKIKQKIKNGQSVSYEEAESVLLKLGFDVRSRGSHHVFSKDGYEKNISIKKRSELLPYEPISLFPLLIFLLFLASFYFLFSAILIKIVRKKKIKICSKIARNLNKGNSEIGSSASPYRGGFKKS
jgi:predicted RNA binding protein YcfA (HicA-like mRNA interferase family)